MLINNKKYILAALAGAIVMLSMFLIYIYMVDKKSNSEVYSTFIYDLLIHSDKYLEKNVSLNGYLKDTEIHGVSLFPSYEVSRFGSSSESIYINFSLKKKLANCLNKYVFLKGKYDIDSQGVAAIVEINAILEIDISGAEPTFKPCGKNLNDG